MNLDLRMAARNFGTREKVNVSAPTSFYVAAIAEDIILSHQWLAHRDIQVHARQNGLCATVGKVQLWIPGERQNPKQRANARLPLEPMYICSVPAQDKKTAENLYVLDLFCGRKSAAKVLAKWGYSTTTLDCDPRREPDICEDVLNWDYKKMFQPGFFHIIAASPPLH